jgi:hypothetical protein
MSRMWLVASVFAASLSWNNVASGAELASWNESASQQFKVEQCVTTPGVPKQCAPAVTYPCPTFSKPGKTCKSQACTPAVPATKTCGGVNFGTFTVAVGGGVDLATNTKSSSASVVVSNTIRVTMFGATVTAPIQCTLTATATTSVCFDVISRTINTSNGSGVQCSIMGQVVGEPIAQPDISMNVCTNINLSVGAKPSGTVSGAVEASVGFPTVNIAGQKVKFPSASWKQTLFSVKVQ